MQFFHDLKNIILKNLDSSDPDLYYQLRLFLIFMLCAIPAFLVFSILHFLDHNTIELIINSIAAFTLMGCLGFIFIVKNKRLVILPSVLILLMILSILLYKGGEDGSRIFWFYFIPLASYFLLGIRLSLLISVLSYAVIFLIFSKINFLPFPVYHYPDPIHSRFLITYTIVSVFSFLFEYVRKQYLKMLRIEQERLKDANHQIHLMAITDSLTGSFNRNYLIEAIKNEIARSVRYHKSFSIIMCDIDHFKDINDRFGHVAGDQALKAFVELIRNSIRENIDCVVRFGGEEFIVLLPQTGLEGAMILADRIRGLTEKTIFLLNHESARFTASFGVVTLNYSDLKALTIDEILNTADKKLYLAKERGRNRVVSD